MTEDAYSAALDSLFVARRAGIDLGLERMRMCLDTLALRHSPLATIQIGGTNGKGSTSAFLASVLRRAGYTVGVYSSPHLLSICERFQINGSSVTREAFIEAFTAVRSHAPDLTFFESTTAMAAWLFDRNKVDVAIYEVGLGGRLDSTTAIRADVSIVTGVGLDHCEFLGDTLEAIAEEKAGIFRSNVPAIIGPAASSSIRELLFQRAARGVMVGDEHLEQVPEVLALKGPHQRGNAACAVAAAMALRSLGLTVNESQLSDGLASAALPGRFEEIRSGLWIDAAHNAQAARSLSVTLADRDNLTIVVGLSKPKDVAGFLAPLRKHCKKLVATQARGERAYPAREVAEAAHGLGFARVECVPDVGTALEGNWGAGRKVLITGSLMVLGEALRALGAPGDPYVVTDPWLGGA